MGELEKRESLESLVPAFLATIRERGEDGTAIRYATGLRTLFAWLSGREITEARLHEFRRWLQKEKPNRWGGTGLRPRSVRLTFTAIFAFADYLERAHQVTGLPRRGSVPLPKLDVPQREVPTPEEVRQFFAGAAKAGAHSRNPEHREYLAARAQAILAVFAHCGLRLAELLALDVADLKRDRAPWLLHVRNGKGAQPRWVPVSAEAQGYLADWLARRAHWCHRHKCNTEALWPVDSRRRLGVRGLRDLFGELLILAGLEGRRLTPHGLRHAFASTLLQDTDIKTIQSLMGHKSVATTIEVYLHTTQERMEQAVEKLGKRYHAEPAGEKAGPPVPAPPREERLSHAQRMRRRPSRRDEDES